MGQIGSHTSMVEFRHSANFSSSSFDKAKLFLAEEAWLKKSNDILSRGLPQELLVSELLPPSLISQLSSKNFQETLRSSDAIEFLVTKALLWEELTIAERTIPSVCMSVDADIVDLGRR